MRSSTKEWLKRRLPTVVLKQIYLARSYSLVQGKLTYRRDGLYTTSNTDFLEELEFVRAYRLGRAVGILNDTAIHYRAYVACWAGHKARGLEGDFVECGVYRGAMSRMVMEYIGFHELRGRRFYLLDTFNGIPPGSLTDEELGRRRPASFEETYDAVEKTFGGFENVTIIRGVVPATLAKVPSEKIAYLSLDMNAAAPEVAAAEYFWPKMVSGAVMVLDDYGWRHHEVQKRECDAFAARHGVKVLPLPTGQGLIFKP